MIHIRKGQLNRIGLSLRELSIATDPEEYRFDFVSENSKDVSRSVTLTPVSSTVRLQVFEIWEPVPPAQKPLPPSLEFPLTGYYNYEVYQTASNNLVEVGLLKVVGEDEVIQEYIEQGNSQVYGG